MSRAAAHTETESTSEVLEEAYVDLEAPDFASFWTALVWRFLHTNPASPEMSMNWRFLLPGGGYSTDPAFYILLESFKTVVFGMLKNAAYGKKLSVGTLESMSGGVRELFRWCVWSGIADFSEITAEVQQQYLSVLPQLIVAREEVYPNFVAEGYNFGYHSESRRLAAEDSEEEDEASYDADSEDDGISYSQVKNRLTVLYYIHAQRELLEARRLPVFTAKPFGGRPVGEVSTTIAKYVINRIPALPLPVSLPMLTEVFRWVHEVGPRVQSAHSTFQAKKKSGAQALVPVFASLDDAGFREEMLAVIPWRERTDSVYPGGLALDSHRMRLAVLMFRDACVLALQYLAGLRISEVCSPRALKSKVDGLPSCIYKRESPDGMMDLYFLKGLLVKGRGRPKKNDWVIGCAPRGSSQIPVLVQALDVLHDVFSPFLKDTQEKPLFMHFKNPWGMPKGIGSVKQANGLDLQRGCRRFLRCFVDLSQLPDYDSFGNSLVRYRESRGQCIRTHQGRKSFAEFCLKTRKSAISQLSLHFGHLTESTTYSGYYEPIQRLDDDLETFGHSATVDFFVSRSEGRVVFGAMAETVNRFFDEFELNDIKDIQVLREKVTDIVIAHNIRIYFNDHGNCFMSIAPLKSRCQAAAGGASWMLTRPNEKTRTVSMCLGCDCLGLDRTHLPYYEQRAETWSAAAKDPTNRVAVKSFEQSKRIIRLFKERADVTV